MTYESPIAAALRPFSHPRATTRHAGTNEIDKDVLELEVTMGDWWKLLTVLGLFDAEMAQMYEARCRCGRPADGLLDGMPCCGRCARLADRIFDLAVGEEGHLSHGFADELRAIVAARSEFCPSCGSAIAYDKSGHLLYGGRLAYRDFEQILLALGASGSDVQRLWPEEEPDAHAAP